MTLHSVKVRQSRITVTLLVRMWRNSGSDGVVALVPRPKPLCPGHHRVRQPLHCGTQYGSNESCLLDLTVKLGQLILHACAMPFKRQASCHS